MQLFHIDKVMIILGLVQITACTEWDSVPRVVDQHYGQAYHAMLNNQALCPEQGAAVKGSKLCPKHADISAIDGQKAQEIVKAYRQGSTNSIENAKRGVVFDSKTVGGGALLGGFKKK